MSYTVGAERGDVLRVVFASTLVSVGSGMLAGLALTLALNRILEKWEGNARDPVVLLAGTMLLIVVSRIALSHTGRSLDRPSLRLKRNEAVLVWPFVNC